MEELNKPATTPAFDELLAASYEYLNEQQSLANEKYGISGYEKWFYDQETGLLDFSDSDEVKIRIRFQCVGSISKISNTWLWAWDNPHVEQIVKEDVALVKAYGEENGIEMLTKAKWFGDEYDGWEMTAIAAYLLKAKGAYRFPLENTFSFVVYKEIIDLRDQE